MPRVSERGLLQDVIKIGGTFNDKVLMGISATCSLLEFFME